MNQTSTKNASLLTHKNNLILFETIDDMAAYLVSRGFYKNRLADAILYVCKEHADNEQALSFAWVDAFQNEKIVTFYKINNSYGIEPQ